MVGADDEIRTRDIDLGKVALYQLSYIRVPVDQRGDATSAQDDGPHRERVAGGAGPNSAHPPPEAGILRLVVSWRAAAALAIAILTLAGCSSEKDPEPSKPTAQDSPAPAPAPAPAGGTPDQPTTIEATASLMEWVPAPGAVENTVTTNGTWFLTVEASGTGYRLDGPDQSFGTGAAGSQITNALLDTDWAVVVRQDRSGKKPASAEVTDLGTGEQFTIDQGSDVPTVSGGTWALGGDTVAHATTGPDGGYCVATVDLASRESTIAWCAEAKHGFNAAHVTDPAPRSSPSTTPSRPAGPSGPSPTTSSGRSGASPSARRGRARCSPTTRRSGR